MVVTRLAGGLGNQMFQYACGKALAIKHNEELILDLDWFSEGRRPFVLQKFKIKAERGRSGAYRNLRKQKNSPCEIKHDVPDDTCYIKDKERGYDASLSNRSGNIYLHGYWQSEKYFMDMSDTIRREFVLNESLSENSMQWASRISRSACPVSIHIRRGDYVDNETCQAIYKELPPEYYVSCINDIVKRYDNVEVYAFSNDVFWSKNNLRLDVPLYFVEGNDEDHGYEDLVLMSMCHHNVIANSTFSWWAAWLNNNQNKLVYTPAEWFKAKELNNDDLLPARWIKVDV